MSHLRKNRSRSRSIVLLVLTGLLVPFSVRAIEADRPASLDDVPALLRQLDCGESNASFEAAMKLSALAPVALDQAMPEFNRLRHSSIYRHTRIWAAELMDRVPVQHPAAIRKALGRSNPNRTVVPDLGRGTNYDREPSSPRVDSPTPPIKAPPADPPVWDRDIPKWTGDLSSPQNAVRIPAAQLLATSAPHDSKGMAIGPLCLALNSDDNLFRIEVAEALRSYGHAAASAAPALSRMVDNADPELRFAAVRALLQVDAPLGSLTSALIASILQHDEACCDTLAAHLRREVAPKLLLQLTEMSQSDPDKRVRALAANSEEALARSAPQ